MQRNDLLDLTPEALTALANAGFVKRAQKELADGQIPLLQQADNGTLTARFSDGVQTSLAPQATLRDAQCSCPASGMCRHRVILVLAYQRQAREISAPESALASPPSTDDTNESAWTPADFAEAVTAFPPATLRQAVTLAAAHPVAKLSAWQPGATIPSASLPMCNVRFFSRNNVAHARCDCKQGSSCAHVVVAVWAFAQAQRRQPGFVSLSLEVQAPQDHSPQHADHVPDTNSASKNRSAPDASRAPTNNGSQSSNGAQSSNNAANQLQDLLDKLSLQLWLEGTRQPLMAMEPPFEQAIACADQLGWLWVSETLHDLRNGILAQHARSNRSSPLDILRTLAHFHARIQAARHAHQPADNALPALPASQILGIGIKGEVALDHLRLVSLGALAWSDQKEEGASVVFVDPDTLALTVIERSWPLATTGQPAIALRDRRVTGQPLRTLAASQIVTKAAKRRANGRLEIATGARNTNVMPLSPQSWDAIGAPIRQPDAAALRQHLLHATPAFVSPRQALEHLHILPVARVIDWGWDAAHHTLYADLLTGMDVDAPDATHDALTLTLSWQHDALTPHAVDALACVLSGQWGALTHVAGTVRIEGLQLMMEPLAVLTTQRAVMPAFDMAEKQTLPVNAMPVRLSPLMSTLRETQDILSLWLRQGLRHQGPHALQRGQTQASALAEAGLSETALLLRSALKALSSSAPATLPAKLATLVVTLEELAKTESLAAP